MQPNSERQSTTKTMKRVVIHSTNETPRCGSGRRVVGVSVGRKYVRLYPQANPERFPDRVPALVYQRILDGDAS